MKYNNINKDLKVKMFYSGRGKPEELNNEVNDFLSQESINILDIIETSNSSARWITIYHTESKKDLDGIL